MTNHQFNLKPFYLICLAVQVFLFSTCTERKSEQRIVELTDDFGRKVRVVEKPEKVMALSSSLTEMLYLICEESKIVGRTHNCDYPPRVLKKEVVSNYPIDYEKLLSLNPDMVFAKEGIVSLEEAQKIESMGIPVYFQKYHQVNDILNGLTKLGEILNKKERTAIVVDSLRKDIDKLKASVAGLNKPKVLMLIAKEQLFVFGKDSYASDMLVHAGAINAVDEIFSVPFPQVTSEYILKINPDIMIGLNGVGLENGELFELYPELKRLDLYKNKKYYPFPEDLLSRPGPRAGEAIRQLIKIAHPDVL